MIDWGVKETKVNKNIKALKLIDDLIDRYQPNVIVVEDYEGKGSRWCYRVGALINDISKLAAKRKNASNAKRAPKRLMCRLRKKIAETLCYRKR